jgi:hypothetical protein
VKPSSAAAAAAAAAPTPLAPIARALPLPRRPRVTVTAAAGAAAAAAAPVGAACCFLPHDHEKPLGRVPPSLLPPPLPPPPPVLPLPAAALFAAWFLARLRRLNTPACVVPKATTQSRTTASANGILKVWESTATETDTNVSERNGCSQVRVGKRTAVEAGFQ